MYRLAQVISWILSPLVLIGLLLAAAVMRVQVSPEERGVMIAIIFGVVVIPTCLTLVFLKKTKRVSDWSISKRSDRFKLIPAALLCGLVSIIMLNLLNLPHLIPLLFSLILGGILFGIVTLSTKISAHAAAAMLTSLYFVEWFGFEYMWSFLLVLLVGWSRIYLKHHSLTQVILGILLSLLLSYLSKTVLLLVN